MIVADQCEAIDFLSRPQTHGGASVTRIDTHASIVFLAGRKAYKLKRAVVFPYLDFGTLERRRRFCEAEVAVNRRTAPEIYERAAAITKSEDGTLAFDGAGAPIDYVVVMNRFDEDGLFDRLAARGALDDALMLQLADEIARFHGGAERTPEFGGANAMAEVAAGNDANLRRHGAVFQSVAVERLSASTKGTLSRTGALLDARRDSGYVRRCHGDLHLRNICLYEGRPLIFDAIEFSDSLACIDVLYDLAFLLMDLERRGLAPFGNRVFNCYLALTPEENLRGLAALPLFLSCRAAVRAHVGADAALTQADTAAKARGFDEARVYLDLAIRLLEPAPARLVAVGGLSGSGKSTLARALAPGIGAVPGAVVLRSDVIRKRLAGVAETTRLSKDAYTPAMSERVYAAIRTQAEMALAAGHSAIADAVHARPEEREALEALAARLGVDFTGLWLDAPAAELERRIGGRAADASDATTGVLRRQLGYELGEIRWRRIEASAGAEATLAAGRSALGV